MKLLSHFLIAMAAAGLTMTATAASGIQVYPLGDDNTLVKVAAPQKYLMLPVQESMPDSRIDILVNGDVARTIYVRMADSNVDYCVPLDLTPFSSRGEVVLNVVSEVDRAHSRNASDYICWDYITTADSIDTANIEKFRPAFHHTPSYGWMNDPNGMFYKDGRWHLYYQWNPYGSKWQNMTWGHSSSADLVNWEHHPAAIEPNGLGTVFSGSAVVDVNGTAGLGDSTVVALYTSCAHSQVQSMAYSHDNGRTFINYPGNPVIANPTEARDPNMFWHEPTQQWVLVLAHALEKEMQIYTSPNLIDWTLRSSFGKGYGSQDGVWECPDLFQLPVQGEDIKKWVLLCNINPGSPMGGSGTQYFTGEFDGVTFTPDTAPDVQKWMDYGKDHYAAVSWSNAPDGRRTAIGWMSNWQYANDVPTRQFRSANTLPRDLGLFRGDDGEIYMSSVPAPELLKLRSGKTYFGRFNAGAKGRIFAIPALCEIVIDYDASECDSLNIELYNHAGETVTLSVKSTGKQVSMDRRNSGIADFSAHFPAVTSAPTHKAEAKGQIRLFVDHSSIEAFGGDGEWVMTNLVFPASPYTNFSIQAHGGKAKIGKVEIYDIK